jgi:prepilin-type N-terminal cleavage/methylation domain-containing protein
MNNILKKGFTLIEVLVGTFLLLIVFLGVFLSFQLGLKVVNQSKNRVVAVSIAVGQLEKAKNLPYDKVGTNQAGCYPCGDIEAQKINNFNGINYNIQTSISYVVDPKDGISLPDDSCPNDYKRIKVKVSWSGALNGESEITEDIAPKNLAEECSQTGGVLMVSVFDSSGTMINSPLIEIKNPTTFQTIASATPFSGEHFFSLEPGVYKISISKEGYNSEQTYSIAEIAAPQNPNPNIIRGMLTQLGFTINQLGSFSVDTLSSWGVGDFSDSFMTSNKISESSNIVVDNGQVQLSNFSLPGYVMSSVISPSELIGWNDFSWNDEESAGTEIIYQLFFLSGENWVLIPDSSLPDNSTGLSSPVNLSSLDKEIYFSLKMKASLYTENFENSPKLLDWQISWRNSQPTSVPFSHFNLRSQKILGKDVQEKPVYKYSENLISGSGGHININNIESDSYTFSPASGSSSVVNLEPDSSVPVNIYIESQNSLTIIVRDLITSEPVFSAECHVHNSDYDQTQSTNEQGQTYFVPLIANAYNLEITAPGYNNYSSLITVLGKKIKSAALERNE